MSILLLMAIIIKLELCHLKLDMGLMEIIMLLLLIREVEFNLDLIMELAIEHLKAIEIEIGREKDSNISSNRISNKDKR